MRTSCSWSVDVVVVQQAVSRVARSTSPRPPRAHKSIGARRAARRKLSGGTRAEAGRQARDTFIALMKTCRKLGVSYWDYLGDRLDVPTAKPVPPLADLVRQKCLAMA